MEVQTETYRAAMNGTLERHFSDMIAVIPTKITIEQLKLRLETIATKVDELKIVYSDETSIIVELHMDEKITPYELHIDEANDPEEYKMYNRQDSTLVDRNFEDAAYGTEIFTRTLFVGDVLDCFFQQLQFLWNLAPDLLFVIDSSAAMKVISSLEAILNITLKMNYYLTFLTCTLFILFMKTIKKVRLRNIGFIHMAF